MQASKTGVAFTAGIVPTLLANAINAGGVPPGGTDVAPSELSPDMLWAYFGALPFVLRIIAWTGLILRLGQRSSNMQVALVVAGNLVVNVIFFMTHPVFTPYYTIPVAMLSLCTLLFATVIPHWEVIGDSLAFRQPVKA